MKEVVNTVIIVVGQNVNNMNKQEFKKEIEELISIDTSQCEFIEKMSDIGVEVIDSQGFENYNKVFDIAVKSIITDENKQDTFYWYLYEYLPKFNGSRTTVNDAEMWDENNNPMCYDLDSLVDYLYE